MLHVSQVWLFAADAITERVVALAVISVVGNRLVVSELRYKRSDEQASQSRVPSS
jgi:hypothetical protein